MGMIMKDGIPYGGIYPIDDAPTQGSNNAVKSGGVYSALSNKVDKVAGKGLSTNDYDNTEKEQNEANAEAIEAIVNKSGSCNIYPPYTLPSTLFGLSVTNNADGSFTIHAGTSTNSSTEVVYMSRFATKAGAYKASGGVSESERTKIELATTGWQGIYDSPVDVNVASDTTIGMVLVIYANVTISTDLTFYPMIYDARLKPTGYVSYAKTNKELTDDLDGKVSKSGDTMTGDLVINKANAALKLKASGSRYTNLMSAATGSDKTLYLPNQDGTLATIDDVNAVNNVLGGMGMKGVFAGENSTTFTLKKPVDAYTRYSCMLWITSQSTNIIGMYIIGVNTGADTVNKISGLDATLTRNGDDVTITFTGASTIWSGGVLIGPSGYIY